MTQHVNKCHGCDGVTGAIVYLQNKQCLNERYSVVMELGKWGQMPPRLDGHVQYSNGLIFEWGLKTGQKSEF